MKFCQSLPSPKTNAKNIAASGKSGGPSKRASNKAHCAQVHWGLVQPVNNFYMIGERIAEIWPLSCLCIYCTADFVTVKQQCESVLTVLQELFTHKPIHPYFIVPHKNSVSLKTYSAIVCYMNVLGFIKLLRVTQMVIYSECFLFYDKMNIMSLHSGTCWNVWHVSAFSHFLIYSLI